MHLKYQSLALIVLGAAAASAQPGPEVPPAGALFPQPFLVEHQLVQSAGDDTFAADPVTDYYGGTWLVSVRPDGSRLVIDLARRELTEIRPDRGTYWTVSFDRLAELRDRLAGFEAGSPPAAVESMEKTAAPAEPELVITEPGGVNAPLKAAAPAAAAMLRRPGVRHLRVEVKDAAPHAPALDVWLDPQVRLGPAARLALARFENDALGGSAEKKAGDVGPARLLDAAREHAGGAFPIRTVRTIATSPFIPGMTALSADDPRLTTVENVALRLEPLEQFPLELVRVPDGLRRTVHPLEQVLAFTDQEQAIRDAMAGEPGAAAAAAAALKVEPPQ